MSMFKWAKEYQEMGLTPIPCKNKKPLVRWEKYQEPEEVISKEDLEKLQQKFETANAIGVLVGKRYREGYLYVLDFDSTGSFISFVNFMKSKPSFSNLEKTPITRTRKGFHIWLLSPSFEDVPINKSRIFLPDIDAKGRKTTVKASGGYPIVPPSVVETDGIRSTYSFVAIEHTQNGVDLKRINIKEGMKRFSSIWLIGWSKFSKLLSEAGFEPAKGIQEIREIQEEVEGVEEVKGANKLRQIIPYIQEAWVEGYRHDLAFFLAGWLRKAGFTQKEAEDFIKAVCQFTGDKEIENRLGAVRDTYNGKPLKLIKGVSGVGEILYSVFRTQGRTEEKAREEARGRVFLISEVMGCPSSFGSFLFSTISKSKNEYAVIDMTQKLCGIGRKHKNENGIYLDQTVFVGVPKKITMIKLPIGDWQYWRILWSYPNIKGEETVLSEGESMQRIVSQLSQRGLVLKKDKAQDMLSIITHIYRKNGEIEYKVSFRSPGFYLLDGKDEKIVVEGYDYNTTKTELKEGLKTLDTIAKEYYPHALDRFSTVTKWFIVSPFSYAMKERGKFIPWLFLHGKTKTGKTAIAKLLMHIWYNKEREITNNTGGSDYLNSEPRIREMMGKSTFPFLGDEVEELLSGGKKNLSGMFKSCITELVAGGRLTHDSVRQTFPALRCVVFTSNRLPPKELAVLRRLVLIPWTNKDLEAVMQKQKKFNKNITKMAKKLNPIGKGVAQEVLKNPQLLDLEEDEKDSWEVIGEEILKRLYRYVGLKVPDWVNLRYEGEGFIEALENEKEDIREKMVELFNDIYSRNIREGHSSIRERVTEVLEKGYASWGAITGNRVKLSKGFLNTLNISGLTTLQELAELLRGEGVEVETLGAVRLTNQRVKKGIKVKLDDFLNFLEGNTENKLVAGEDWV